MKFNISFSVIIVLFAITRMSAQNKVGIGTLTPDYRLHISAADSSLLKLENTTGLSVGVRSSLFFKTGTKYTGAIKTIGTGTNSARLSLFTYAGDSPTSLIERLSILDNGNIGINTTDPDYSLHLVDDNSSLFTLENTSVLASNESADQFFKIGTSFTGAIRTIGTGATTARLGLYTFSSASAGALIERVSILNSGNVGIGTISPADLLSFANGLGDKINFYHVSATSKYGIGLQGGLLQFYSDGSASDLAFGYGSSAAFTERMRIKGSGNVGIGNTNPLDAGLIVDKKVGAVNAMFGRNTTGVSIESNYPGIGFNCYYNAARKTIAAGYAGLINADPVTGNLGLYNSNVSTAADGAATLLPRLLINKDGNIGVEGNTTPHTPLSFATNYGRKISLYGGNVTSHHGFGVQTNVMQMYVGGPAADLVFGHGSSETLIELMRIKGSGNVGIGTDVPVYKLDIKTSTADLLRIENSTALATNVRADLYFKSGTYYTGAIKTIGTSSFGARLGLFTYASGNPTVLIERLSILDGGNVGIGTISPDHQLEVVSSQEVTGFFNNTSVAGTVIGVAGRAWDSPDGIGVLGEGREVGVYAEADIAGTGDRSGVRTYAINGTGNNYGIYAYAFGGSTAFGIYATAGSGATNWAGYFAGSVYTTGTYQGSDRKLKSGIASLKNPIGIIQKLNPTSYTYKTNEYPQMQLPEGTQYGLIADEVKQIMPGAVKKVVSPAQFENNKEGTGKKISDEVEFEAVNYTQMIPILIAAMQEQQKEIDALKEEIVEQRKIIQELERK